MFFGFYKYSCVSFCRWACQDLILLYTRTECVAIVNYLHLLNDRVVAVSYTLYWMTVRLCSVLQRRISMWYCLQIRLLSCLPFCLFVYFVLTMYLRGLSRLKNEWRNEGTNEGRNYQASPRAWQLTKQKLKDYTDFCNGFECLAVFTSLTVYCISIGHKNVKRYF